MKTSNKTVKGFLVLSPHGFIGVEVSSPFIGSIDKFRYFAIEPRSRNESPVFATPIEGISKFEPKGQPSDFNANQDKVGTALIDSLFDFHSDQEEDKGFITAHPECIYHGNPDIPLKFLNHKIPEKKTENVIQLAQIMDLSEYESILDAQKIAKEYSCKYCGESFKNGCALGGHISKVHKATSRGYAKKLSKTRNSLVNQKRAKFFKLLARDEQEY